MTIVRVVGKSTRVTVGPGAPTRVIVSRDVIAKIDANRPRTQLVKRDTPVRVEDKRPIQKISLGVRGEKGDPGETEGATFLTIAGEFIHGGRAVRIVDGVITHPKLSEPSHATQVRAIAVQSGPPGSSLLVRSGGVMEDNSWSWSPGFVWCGDDGVLTQTPPTTGWTLKVGGVNTSDTISVDIDDPFIRG